MKRLLLIFMAVCLLASCSKDGGEETTSTSLSEQNVVTVVKAEYKTPTVSVNFNPIRANYIINWSAITGSTEYNVYKSNTPSGEGALVATTSDMTITSTETLAHTAGKYIRYYWVTAKTNTGETLRPDNGGIKATYTVTVTTKVWMPNSTPPLYGYWITTGYDGVERVIEQNPIR